MGTKIRIIIIFAFSLMLCGCSLVGGAVQAEEMVKADVSTEAVREIFAMDTYMTVKAYGINGEEAVEAAIAEIERLDALLSTGNKSSEVAGLNDNGGGSLSEETEVLLERSLDLYQSTDGAFDIAIYPVMKAWGFTDSKYRVPPETELIALLELADPSLIEYDRENHTVFFGKEGMQIDFGGIAKGYTSARIMDIYREYGISSGLVNLGGNVQAFGTKPDGSDWRVAIQSPDDSGAYMGVLSVSDRAVITSGGYERYFEQDGEIYHHIIDPVTGYPAHNGLTSVTIVSTDGILADGLSTSLFIMGQDKAEDYWRAHSDEFDMILLSADDELYITEGIMQAFSSDHEVRIIEKDGEE
ncbi:MAG: FAD:protein FMN transferase [Coprococcus sp.]